MKRIEALIRPQKLDEATDALIALGIDDFTVSNVRGTGREQRQKLCYRGLEYAVEFVSVTRLEFLVSDTLLPKAVESICMAARTGNAVTDFIS